MLNKIILMGRLTRDPELRRTGSGTAVTSFSLAVDRDFKSQSGEKETDFIDIVAWRSTAEFVSRYFTKGQLVAVEGQIQTRTWEDKAGQKRKSVEIVASDVYFAEPKRDGQSAPRQQQAPAGGFDPLPGGSYGGNEFAALPGDDNDLPF